MAVVDIIGGITLDGANNNQNHSPDINRYLGGARRGVDSHPYVKGYFYVFFGFPTDLFPDSASEESSIIKERAMIYTLSAAEGYTPPGDRQLKTEDIAGQGGVDSSFITGQTLDRNFSIQYRDYWGAPIFRIHRQWTQYLNPYIGGATTVRRGDVTQNVEFAPYEYKGTCMIIQTKPVTLIDTGYSESDIIKVDYFDGVFPTTDLKSAYDSNITDNGIVRPTVQYRFDGFPLDETNPAVRQKALQILNSVDYNRANASPKIYEDLIESNDISGLNYSLSGQ